MKKKLILILIAIVAVAAVAIAVPMINKIGKDNLITSSQLTKAIDINELSTAEFVYNGVAEKYKDDDPSDVECYIAYNANVKVGIKMSDVSFRIDEKAKTVTPILPDISINIATLDEGSISYIPKNPQLSLKEVITLCKDDVMNEANRSKELYELAEENLKAVIEALLSPILDHAGYSLVR